MDDFEPHPVEERFAERLRAGRHGRLVTIGLAITVFVLLGLVSAWAFLSGVDHYLCNFAAGTCELNEKETGGERLLLSVLMFVAACVAPVLLVRSGTAQSGESTERPNHRCR